MMDFTRRDFLKGLAASALALGFDPYAGIAVAADRYQNRRLGLSFGKPKGWEFDSIADFAAVRERQTLLFEDSEQAHPLKDPENLPIVIMFNPKYQRGDFAPAISLWDEPLSHPNPPTLSEEVQAHHKMIQGFSRSYKSVKTIERAAALEVDGAKGTRACWSYVHEINDGQSFLLKIDSLLFFRFPRVHTYYVVDSCSPIHTSPAMLQEFIQSINYQR